MNWHYAQNGQPRGPVNEVELMGLVVSGLVTDQTLVWHEGMPNWQPYGEVKSGVAPPVLIPSAPPPQPTLGLSPDETICAECGGVFPKDQTIQLGAVSICAACKPRHIQKLKEGMTTAAPGTLRYAGFWLRFAAKLIDWFAIGLVVGIPSVILMFASMGKLEPDKGPPLQFLAFQILIQFLSIAGTVAYNTLMVGKYGATLGKMALGLRVVTADNTSLTYLRAFGRAWAEMLSQMICYIGYFLAASDDQRRALHDHICNTRVVFK
jgi:uncharacterized RDD family membrane protein YckC